MTLRKGFPAKLSGSAADADDVRYDLAGLIVRDSFGVPRSGLFAPGPTALLTATASWNVSVAAFAGSATRDGGSILLANDGAANALITGGAPASNSRLDVIYAKQNDSSSTVTVPDANNLPIFGVLTGIPSATPVRNPSGLPAGALELGTIQIPSTATATNSAGVIITPTFQNTVAAGGILPTPTAALPATPYAGQGFFDTTQGAWVGSNGTGIVPLGMKLDLAAAGPSSPTVPFMKAGAIAITFSSGTALFTFPVAFPTTCLVLIVTGQVTASPPGLSVYAASPSALSKTANTLAALSSFSGSITINYIAIGW